MRGETDSVPALMVLGDPQSVKAYANPTRIAILGYLKEEAMSVSAVARRLKTHPANLTHHFRLLQAAGLIQAAGTRGTRRRPEKLYRAGAREFVVKDRALGPAEAKTLAFSVLREDLALAAGYARTDRARPVLTLLAAARLTESDVGRFLKELESLAKRFSAADRDSGAPYTINASIYPRALPLHGHGTVQLHPARRAGKTQGG